MMGITLYCDNSTDLPFLNRLTCPCEVLFEAQETSKRQIAALSDVQLAAQDALSSGIKPILLWDLLMTENQLNQIAAKLQPEHLKQFSAIRVSDLGAAKWIVDNLVDMPIQLNVENSSLNIAALQSWSKLFGSRLSKLVLGIQAGHHFISNCRKHLPDLDLELLGAGPLLGFRSARQLLSPLLQTNGKPGEMRASAVSLEDPSISLIIEQKETATAVFFDHDLCLLEQIDLLKDLGVSWIRIDARNIMDKQIYYRLIESIADAIAHNQQLSRDLWPFPSKSFCFETGVATRPYHELKSKRQLTDQGRSIAQVIAVQSGKWFALHSQEDFPRQEKYSLLWPSGQIMTELKLDLTTMDGNKPEIIQQDKLVISFDWIKGICPGAQLFKPS